MSKPYEIEQPDEHGKIQLEQLTREFMQELMNDYASRFSVQGDFGLRNQKGVAVELSQEFKSEKLKQSKHSEQLKILDDIQVQAAVTNSAVLNSIITKYLGKLAPLVDDQFKCTNKPKSDSRLNGFFQSFKLSGSNSRVVQIIQALHALNKIRDNCGIAKLDLEYHFKYINETLKRANTRRI